jgi:hypothetical protein
MKNKEKAQLEAQHRKEMESLREEFVRLTSLLEQALRSKPEEAKFISQPEPMLVNPQNLGQVRCLNRLCIPNLLNQHIP